MKRIEVFFGEEEVSPGPSDEELSSLTTEIGLGLKEATLMWNEVPETNPTTDSRPPSPGDRKFQLKDITVVFPQGKLSVIMGPTASGKTALLVCCFVEVSDPSLIWCARWPFSVK